jgi:hypothetical protein
LRVESESRELIVELEVKKISCSWEEETVGHRSVKRISAVLNVMGAAYDA